MNITIGRTPLNKHKPNSIYLGRGASNQKYKLLSNDFSHKDGTLAEHKVETVEDAVREFENNLVRKLRGGCTSRASQMRCLLEESKELSNKYGSVIYLCWCKDEAKPNNKDHSCHCDVLRKYIMNKYKQEEKE